MRRVARLLSLVTLATILCAPGSPARSAERAPATVPVSAKSRDGNRLTYLDENDPLRSGHSQLITPQWVGEGSNASSFWRSTTCASRRSMRPSCGPSESPEQIDGRAPVAS